ncbi:MAG: hypothetical protein OXG98_07225 [Gemmatimonadetes bacterium]|nr:hypothetical protein [Gemmatimonadota bacterium]
MDNLTAQLERIRKRFEDGELTVEDIDRALGLARNVSGGLKQGLLYLQAPTTNPHSAVVGISIYEDGADSDGLDENGDFRYRSIKEALDDGWRIIKFPEASLAMREQDTYGLGYEFVLERWR